MRIAIVVSTFFICNSMALRSIWEEFAMSESKTFYNSINNMLKYHSFQTTLQSTATNMTFFIPSENAVQSAIKNNLFSNSTPLGDLMYTILPKVYGIQTLSSTTKRQYVSTLSSNYSTIILSPPTATKNIQVLAGTTVANITNHTMCSNGIVYHVDQFITAPLEVITTISSLSELNQLENTIKSQNLSNIFTSTTANQTIFAPIDAAWDAVNGANIPFGTMIHDLKYHVVDGIYYQQDLLVSNLTLVTTYASATIQTESYADDRIVVIGGSSLSLTDGANSANTLTVANIVQSDILTSQGKIIHLIDKILVADPNNAVSLAKTNVTTNYNTRPVNSMTVQISFCPSSRIYQSFSLLISMIAVIMLCF